MPDVMDAVVNLCKRRGFIFPSAEIYGGFRSAYDYGPLGSLMLRNVKNEWDWALQNAKQLILLMARTCERLGRTIEAVFATPSVL